jgi:hypothetical protein
VKRTTVPVVYFFFSFKNGGPRSAQERVSHPRRAMGRRIVVFVLVLHPGRVVRWCQVPACAAPACGGRAPRLAKMDQHFLRAPSARAFGVGLCPLAQALGHHQLSRILSRDPQFFVRKFKELPKTAIFLLLL